MIIRNKKGVILYIGARVDLDEFTARRSEFTKDELTPEYSNEEKLEAVNKKIAEYNINEFLVINEYVYSTKREDILKYKEATDISKNMGADTVKLKTGNGNVELSISESEGIIKQLSEKSLSDYWSKQDFIELVESKNEVSEIESITT